MKYRYHTCDVFTEHRFGGNPLAVLPHAQGLSDLQMQQIAREFNYAETAFVFPPEAGHTRKVRLFTPAHEVPFAGHPNIGTAFVLASTGEFGQVLSSRTVIFEEKAGLVPIRIEAVDGKIASCELTAPLPLSLGPVVPAALVAAAVSVTEEEIVTQAHPPRVCSVGLPFVITQVRDLSALERVRANTKGFEDIRALFANGNELASLYL
jgi:trans-2,3-dihydro-3-hydroxyanthranilate isomerase